MWMQLARALRRRRLIPRPFATGSKTRELTRVRALPRHQPTTTDLPGPTIRLVEAASFLAQHQTIILLRSDPLILDCGANIGLASIYWKRLYPLARIVTFEPDPDIFPVSSWNLDHLGFTDVKRLQKAVWTSATQLPFWSEGADGGRVLEAPPNSIDRQRSVPAVRLRDYLDRRTDLLKVDIEGAEVDVILDCVDRLLDSGFRVHILPDVVSPQPFITRLDNMCLAIAPRHPSALKINQHGYD